MVSKPTFIIMTLSIMVLSITKLNIMTVSIVTIATRKLVKRSEAGLLNKSSCLAPTLVVTKFIIVTGMIWVTLCCTT
jgi:hypothetical protein